MAYEIDRDEKIEPSLTEMSKKALDILYNATKETERILIYRFIYSASGFRTPYSAVICFNVTTKSCCTGGTIGN